MVILLCQFFSGYKSMGCIGCHHCCMRLASHIEGSIHYIPFFRIVDGSAGMNRLWGCLYIFEEDNVVCHATVSSEN